MRRARNASRGSREVGFSRSSRPGTNTTLDHHDYGTVEVTEHWNDRQDVTVKPETIHIKPRGTVHGA